MPSLSIIIITLNEAERIGSLLEDLAQQNFLDFEVIVVDSNSEDETCDIASRYAHCFKQLTVERMQSRGICLGRNTGAELASYEHILFLDADVRLPKDFLEKSMRNIKNNQLKVAGAYLSPQGLSRRYVLGYKVFNAGIFVTQYMFPTAIGACLFSTKTIHERINGFDPTITLCEDCDYVNRASRHTRFRMLPTRFTFDPRRLKQDGILKTGWKYLYANAHRLVAGEIRNQKIKYDFGHYKPHKSKVD